jgi:hypothetical protein
MVSSSLIKYRTSSSYPERWRERPCETSATSWLTARKVPIPSDPDGFWKMRSGRKVSPQPADIG